MESLIAPILIISAVFNFFLGVLMVLQGYRGVFSFAIAGVTLWDISILFFYSNIAQSLNWAASAHFFAIVLAISFYLFSLRFPREIKAKTNKALTQYVPILLFLCMSGFIVFSNLIVGPVDYKTHAYFIGRYYPLYSFLLGAYFMGGAVILLRQYKDAEVLIEKQQIRFILIGALVSIVVSTVTDLVFPYLNIFNYIWAGPFSTIMLVVSVSVAILRYNLFSLKLILVELAVLLLNMFLLFNVFTSHATADMVLNIAVSAFVLVFSIVLIRGIYKDIKDREKIEELAKEMEVANEHMRALEGQKTEFVSIASHQLRTPLTVIKGYASMILEGTFGSITDDVRDAIGKLYKSSDKIVSLVEDLLTVSRLEQGRMTLHFEPVNLVEFTQGVLSGIATEAAEAGIDLAFTAEEDKQFIAEIDATKFRQVLKHILENATKYTRAPGGVRVALSEDNITNKIRLSISDTGTGMTKEQIQAIFERFDLKVGSNSRTSENLTKEEFNNSLLESAAQKEKDAVSVPVQKMTPGIGLYIAKQIIDAHHGSLFIESAGENRGVTITVEVPRSAGGVK